MKSKIYHHKLMSKIFFISIFTLLSINSAFSMSVNISPTFQANCPWALVTSNIYITGATQKIYPTDLIRSNTNLLFIRNEESSVNIWQNTANTLTAWCLQPLNASNTWWGRMSNVVQPDNQWVWAFKIFWNICDVNKVIRTNNALPSVQFVYRVAYKSEISLGSWNSSYYYYPYIWWILSSVQTFIPNQTIRNWWAVTYHPDECHNFTFSYCWDWTLDAANWETCDNWNLNWTPWNSCSATCHTITGPTCWTAWGYHFSHSETTWPSNLTFCSNSWATVNPNPPVFPAQW
jgi:hypothetical protein